MAPGSIWLNMARVSHVGGGGYYSLLFFYLQLLSEVRTVGDFYGSRKIVLYKMKERLGLSISGGARREGVPPPGRGGMGVGLSVKDGGKGNWTNSSDLRGYWVVDLPSPPPSITLGGNL